MNGGTKYVCDLCEYPAGSKGNMSRHIREEHPFAIKRARRQIDAADSHFVDVLATKREIDGGGPR